MKEVNKMTDKSWQREQCLKLSYEMWLNSWVGDPRTSFEDYCNGNFKHHNDITIDFDKCSELTDDGKLIIYMPDFIKELQEQLKVVENIEYIVSEVYSDWSDFDKVVVNQG